MYLTKAARIAEAIKLAGAPDILALEEIESADNKSRSLDLLKDQVSALGYKYFALGMQNPNDQTAVTSAVISKYPIVANERLDLVEQKVTIAVGSTTIQGAPEASSARDPQVVTIDVNGVSLRVYASHWKSRRGDFAQGEALRLATATLIKADINKVLSKNPAQDLVVMGDFNSDQTERPLKEGMQLTDDKVILKSANSKEMYDLWFELPASERGSYVYNGERQCIDHILVGGSAFDGHGLDLVEDSFRVVGHDDDASSELLGASGAPFRWQIYKQKNYTVHPGKGYSDHLPLVAKFKLAK